MHIGKKHMWLCSYIFKLSKLRFRAIVSFDCFVDQHKLEMIFGLK